MNDDTYRIGDAIQATVTFSAAVTVTGVPQFTLNVGGGPRRADYESGSGSTDLVFSYTVVDGDEATDGVAVEKDEITLNGGTITAGGTAATLTYDAVAADPAHKVDGIRPIFVSAETTADGMRILVTFSEKLKSASPAAFQVFDGSADADRPDVESVPIAENVVTLMLDRAIRSGDSLTLTIGQVAVTDLANNWNPLALNKSITNNVPPPPPGPPQNVVAEAFLGRVTLDWDPPDQEGDSPITHYEYRLQRDTGSFGDWELADHRDFRHVLGADGTSLVFRDKYIRSDETFTYEVRAVSAVGPGAGAASNAIDTAPVPAIRVALTDVRVLEGVGTLAVNAVLESPDGYGPYDQDGQLFVVFESTSGTATAHEDYTGVSGEAAFGPGDFVEGEDGRWLATVGTEVTILDDGYGENDESFTVKIERGASAPHWIVVPSSNNITTITIEDNDELLWSVTAASRR